MTLVGLAAIFPGLAASLPGASHAQGTLPAAGDHVFVPTSFIPDAFIKTRLSVDVGYASSIETDVPIVGPGGTEIATVQGGLLFLNGSVEFDCAVKDWIGFFARMSSLARAGDNTASIFVSGLSAASGMSVGWEGRFRAGDRSALSGSVEVDQTSLTVIDVSNYVEGIRDTSTTAPKPRLARNYKPLVALGNVQYAHGVSDLLGLSASAGLGWGENPRDDFRNAWFWKVGGVASFNLTKRYDLPLGVAVGLRTSSYPLTFENADGNATAGLLSIAYMGRPDFSIILDASYERVPLKDPDITVGYTGGTIGLRYYF